MLISQLYPRLEGGGFKDKGRSFTFQPEGNLYLVLLVGVFVRVLLLLVDASCF
jgi:hypothetical protein